MGIIVSLELVRKNEENIRRAQVVLESAPNYERLVTGGPVSAAAGEEFFDELPPGKTPDEKSNFIIQSDREDVGVAECIRGWRETGFAHIGLLLIDERFHGRGIGRAAMQEIERWIVSTWPETHTLRIGVIETNSGALEFWKKLGFEDTGERRDNGFLAPAAVMLRQLANTCL
jgi:ribosomal protein S18 acetylase RimI-like enzyme